jgi:hypothetical protein
VHRGHALSNVSTMSHERLLAAARRVLDGDDSVLAASELEGVVLDDYSGDERFDELMFVLSMYAPGQATLTRGRTRSEESSRKR